MGTAVHQDGLVSKVELSFSCKGLLNKDVTSKSDPIVQVMMLQSDGRTWKEIGRTEHLKNTLCPEFVETVSVDYRFEEVQKVKCVVYDLDNTTSTLDDDDFLGKFECNLAQIVSSKTLTRQLEHKTSNTKAGTITISAEEVGDSKVDVEFQFNARNLDKKDFLSKSDPYLEILKSSDGVSYTPVHRTPHIDNTLNPNWKPFTISLQKLCNNNYEMKIKITCYDHDDDGGHDLIGEFDTSMAEMAKAESSTLQWDCVNPKKLKKKRNYKNSGLVMLQSVKFKPIFSFLDYIMSGCQMNFTVGIDFTASNGVPNTPASLHFLNPNEPNEYVKALIAVGEVCQDYDTDKMFPALGFGAKIPPTHTVSFDFPLNFNPSNPYCEGVFGIVAAYQYCVRQIQFYGPTNLSPIINHIMNHTKAMIRGQENVALNYFVLLILTDGVITDMHETIDAIISASYLPISLIIVGVGNADFAAMDFLDSDQGKLRNGSREAYRDIVQFVPFRDFKQSPPAELAKAVLAEVPKQVTEYFKLKQIQPNVPQQVPVNQPT